MTTCTNMSLPYWCAKSERRALGKAWAAAKERKRIAAGVDSDTLAWRSMEDRRGTVLRSGCTYSSTGCVEWLVRHSIAGRSDPFDVVANGHVVKTVGARRLPRRLRP